MQGNNNRILTTHIGSLPRHGNVIEFLKKRDKGKPIDQDTFKRAARTSIDKVVQRQADIGLDIINDGEQSRVGFNQYVPDRLSGYEGETTPKPWSDLTDFPEFVRRNFDSSDELDIGTVRTATGPVEYVDSSRIEWEHAEFRHALSETGANPAGTFMTAATPGVIATSLPNQYYDDYDEYVWALADAMQTEYEYIADSGVDMIQLDSPDLLMDQHKMFADRSVEKFKEIVRLHINALNRAIENVPANQTRLHICWGNYEGPHHNDVALEEVLPLLYDADIGGLTVELANPRHGHEVDVLEEHPLPDDWILFPGVIDVKTNIVEHPENVADRIERVAEVVGDPSRIVAAPDCGFGTLAGWERVNDEIAWKKLETLVEGADLASDRLF